MSLTIRQIVEERLRKDGFDGLCCEGCGCRVGVLMPCDDPVMECRPGYIRYGAFEGGMTWIIVEQIAPRQPEPASGERLHGLVGPGGGG